VRARAGSRRVDARAATATGAAVAAEARRWATRRGGPTRVLEARSVGLDLDGAVRRGFVVDVESGPGRERALLVYDGAGRLLHAAPRSVHALGRVYDPNPPNAMMMTSDVELENLTSDDRLNGRLVRVAGCNAGPTGCMPAQTAVADASGDFLFDPVEPSFLDPFSEVSGYFHTDRAARYFENAHGFGWTCCDEEVPLDVIVNFTERSGAPHDNASYSPSSCGSEQCGFIALGQGRIKDFELIQFRPRKL